VTGDERVAGSEEVTLGHGEGEPFERNVAAASFAYPLGQEFRRLMACGLQVEYSLQRPWMPMRRRISGGLPATAIGVEALFRDGKMPCKAPHCSKAAPGRPED
jgi:hypothetical protein